MSSYGGKKNLQAYSTSPHHITWTLGVQV